MCVFECGWVGATVHVWWCLMLGLTFCIETWSLLVTTTYARLAGPLASSDFAISLFFSNPHRGPEITGARTTVPGLSMGSRHPNTGHQVCSASNLLTKPPLQPLRDQFYTSSVTSIMVLAQSNLLPK